jgi:NAD(P)-dependent dehydrogenase (short-subunit alcohol dehydrogenase family)
MTRTALVTGGAQGIGKAIAARLLSDGYAVIIGDIHEAAGRETEAELRALGDIRFVPADVADDAAVQRLVAAAGDGLDALVNNAGIGIGKPVTELTLDEWHRVLDVNLTGAFLTAKYAAPALRARRGAIINITSTRACMSEANTEAYSASKGGLVALTHALAVSLAPDVRVNCISPGWIDVSGTGYGRTPGTLTEADHLQHPAGRVGTPADIAALAAFLLGPDSGFITGANIMADGGMTRKMIYVE